MSISLNENIKTIAIKKGEALFREGDTSQNFYILSLGSTCSFTVKNSRAIPLRVSIKDDLIGEEYSVQKGSKYNYNVTALVDSELIVVKNEDVQSYLDQGQLWLKNILSAVSTKILNTEKLVSDHQIIDSNSFEDGFSMDTENLLLKSL